MFKDQYSKNADQLYLSLNVILTKHVQTNSGILKLMTTYSFL